MRGEHRAAHRERLPRAGSSPHARGALISTRYLGGAAGIIPACAGSTPTTALSQKRLKDHPRMRGEHTSRPARLVDILA